MFLKNLMISAGGKIIRDIRFRIGLNLIVDETPISTRPTGTDTGNNVGKTTVLQLIDFCFGANPKGIYVDPETKRNEYKFIKDFLIGNKVIITLVLTDDLNDESSRTVVVERNFLARKEIIRKINGQEYTEDQFEKALSGLVFPSISIERPTFRQIISHNIRYRDEIINSTIRTLDKYSSDVEYEALHLFMLGVEFSHGDERQFIMAKLRTEETFHARLEKNQTKTAYETALSLLENEIIRLNTQKDTLNLNANLESDLDRLKQIKYDINKSSALLSNLQAKKSIISDAISEINASVSNTDLNQLHAIYQQAAQNISGLQKQFSDLVEYHNKMAQEKVNFITKELPEVENAIRTESQRLHSLLENEKLITETISKSDSFGDLEKIIIELNEKYQRKGEYESIVQQLSEVETTIKDLNRDLDVIDNDLFSDSFETKVKNQINKFNEYFSGTSRELYAEQYALKYDIITHKSGKRIYKFSSFNLNFSSGKKQGEISCFDIAYISFADSEKIPTLHFLLNDKKELVHDNQLVKISELVERKGIQFVASILRDKLPPQINDEKFFVIKLSQTDKLFRAESFK